MRGSAGHGCSAEPSRSFNERRCPRDIFPLPPMHVSEFVSGCKSRKTQQRRGRRRFFETEVNRTIDSLNQMYGKPGLQHGGELDLENYELSSAQVQAVEFVEQAIGEAGRPDNLSGPEALMELRVSEGYEDLPTSSPFPIDRVRLKNMS